MLRKLISSSIVGIVVLSMVGCNNTTNQTKQSEGTEPKTKVEQQVKDNTTDKTTQHKQHKQVINNNDKTTDNHVKQPENSKDSNNDNLTEEEKQPGFIKKFGGHLEDEAKKQEKIHEQEDQEQQGKYPIRYDEDGTQINDEYGNYTPEYEQKKQDEWNRHENYNDDEDYPNKDVHDNCIDPDDTSNTDSNVEETPSEPVEQDLN